jgi:protein O-GlcNAc transferase
MSSVPEAIDAAIRYHQAGDLPRAEQIYRQALQLDPRHADALHLLGVIAGQKGENAVAVDYICRAIGILPQMPSFHGNLAVVYRAMGRLEEAAASLRRQVELQPDSAPGFFNLGNVLKEQGKLNEAAACYQRTVELIADFAPAYSELGHLLKQQGRYNEAVACFQQAMDLGYLPVHNSLVVTLALLGKLDEAVRSCRQALALKPDFYEAHNNLGNAYKDQGRLDEAAAAYQRAVEIEPGYVVAHSNCLACEQYRAGATLARLSALHQAWHHRHAEPLRTTWRPFENVRDPDRRLRIGFVSADFRRHPVGYFLMRMLPALDPQQCKVVCYSNQLRGDEFTERLKPAATLWREVRGLNDEALVERIRGDRIDILFDLAGHTANNRLLVFARKPAPIQITWAGYVGTTGLVAMDYILADRYQIPAGAESYYQERVLRMPDGYVCYDPPSNAPPVGPLPALSGGFRGAKGDYPGHVTFGSFNYPAKITPDVVRVWSKVLRRTPGSRLVLRYRGFDDGTTHRRYGDLFAAQGIAPDRLDIAGAVPCTELLAIYNQIDIALDTFPYSGGLTTLEALWMGVPVVTCPGETFASRHSLSHLSNVGLRETIAGDFQQYAETAAGLAHDLPRLAALRTQLRPQMAASPLCNGPRFAHNWLSLLRGLWRRWCGE